MFITEIVIITTTINIMAQAAERRQAAEPMRVYTSHICAVCNGRCGMPGLGGLLLRCYRKEKKKKEPSVRLHRNHVR
jgi:hypothetical protein